MKELIERLRYQVICTLDDRIKAADALEHLARERDCFDAAKEEIERLTAERDALKAALQLIKANTNTADCDINAAIQGAGV